MMYLVRGMKENGKCVVRFCKWEETYDLLPAINNKWFDEETIFARMFTSEKRAQECRTLLEKVYAEYNKEEA